MILRDSLMGCEHFEKVIKKIDNDMINVKTILDNKKDYYEESVSYTLSYRSFEKLNAMYSAGYPIEDLKPLFSDILRYSAASADEESGASTPFSCLAPGTLLGFSDVDRPYMQEVLDKAGGKDCMLEFLAIYNGFTYVPNTKRKSSWWGWFPKIKEMATNKEREEYLAQYLKRNWYSSSKGNYWWNYHKKLPNSYFGYWAFDIAAAVRAYGLDDSSFADHKYYPKELAHYLDK